MNGYFITGITAALIGIGVGAGCTYVYEGRVIALEQLSHAQDNERHTSDMLAVSRAALDGENRAIAAHDIAASAVAAADAATTAEKEAHEKDNQDFRAALRDGTERVRVAVTRCTSSRADVPSTASSNGVVDASPAFADLDAKTAERVFRVAGDDDDQISKLKALQAYVCAVRPDTDGCR